MSESTFWDQILEIDEDQWELLHYAKKHNRTNEELFRLLRMYHFHTPIRRSVKERQKPRLRAPNCVRVSLYSGIEPAEGVLACADFPLEPNGDLKTDQIRALWDVDWIMPTYRKNGAMHTPARNDVWSALTVYNLTDGNYNLSIIINLTAEQYRAISKPVAGLRRELRWMVNAFYLDPGWYFNYLFVLSVMYWIASFVPDALYAAFMLVQLLAFGAHALFLLSKRSVSVASSRVPSM